MRKVLKPLIAVILVVFVLFGIGLSLIYQPSYTPDLQVDLPFDTDFDEDRVIVFFGYTGCPVICPTSLHSISQVDTTDSLQTIFIELGDSSSYAADQFAKQFDEKNIGVKLTSSKQQSLIEQFHVFWSRAQPEVGRTASHSQSLYFLKREDGQWTLKNIYKRYPPVPSEIATTLRTL